MYVLVNTIGNTESNTSGYTVVGVYDTVKEAHEAMLADMTVVAKEWVEAGLCICKNGEEFGIHETHAYVLDAPHFYHEEWTKWDILGPNKFCQVAWL